MPAYIFFFSIADLITWKMKQGLMIQSLQPIASPYKNELPHDTELLFELQKVKRQWNCINNQSFLALRCACCGEQMLILCSYLNHQIY